MRFSVRARLKSFQYAVAGLAFMLRTQHNAWLHLIATIAVVAAGFALKVSASDWRWLVVAIVLVWVAETVNTAFEHLCDVVQPEFHASVQRAKDIAAGAVLVWLFNALAAVVRGTGNMALPAQVMVAGVVGVVPLSPLLIFGWGPVPALGIAGGALALLLYYLGGCIALVLYLRSPASLLRPRWREARLSWPLMRDILRVGLLGAVSTFATNLSIGIATALAGRWGAGAIAGYGTASRLEYLLVPLVFGLGAPLVAMVGTCIGAGQRERALRATWIGAAMAFVMAEAIGLWAAAFPGAWLSLFNSDPAMLDAGALYLRTVGPVYGFFGLGLVLYFASQGAGRLLWPVIGNIVRLAVAVTGAWLALRWGGGLAAVFAAQGAALVLYGLVNAWAIAGGAWFGPVGWPRSTTGLLQRMPQV